MDKLLVVRGQLKELLNLLNVSRLWPVLNGTQFTRNGTKLPITNNMTAKFQFGCCKDALEQFSI